MRQQSTRHRVLLVLLPIASVGLAVVLRLGLRLLTGEETPFLLFSAAVLVSAWYGGAGPGLLATGLAAVASNFFFMPPQFKLHLESGQELRLLLFSCEAIGISLLGGHMRSARRQAERKEQESRQLQADLLRVADVERQRMGQDLHDGLGQLLTGTNLLSKALAKQLGEQQSILAPQAERVTELVRESIGRSRALAQGMAPMMLVNDGLIRALEELAAESERLLGIDCRFDSDGADPQLSPEQTQHLYRIAQEAIHNAVRHGRAKVVKVQVRDEPTPADEPNMLALTIANDGFPIDPSAIPDSGLGLRIMRHRATMLGGSLNIGRHGGRTLVTCVIPVSPRQE